MALRAVGVLLFLAHYVLLPSHLKANNLPNLTIMSCLPMTGPTWPGGWALLPPSLMAMDIVNRRDDILADYNLQYVYKDSMCDAGDTVNKVYEMLNTPPVKHYISGPGCSVAIEAVASSTHLWNLTHLSWGGASPVLMDKIKFPTFYSMTTSDKRFNVARLALLRHFNWKKVALINVAMDYFLAVAQDFLQLVKTKAPDIKIISQEIFTSDPMQRIQYLKSKDSRIIVGGGYQNHGQAILCAAYRAGLYGPKVVWIFPGWYNNQWWRVALDGLPCTRDEMDKAAEGHLLTGFLFYHKDVEERGASGLNVREFWSQFRAHPLYRPDFVQYEFASGNAFDSIIGAALALNCTDAYLKQIGHKKSLSDFEYSDGDIGNIITQCTKDLAFLGITGHMDGSRGDSVRSVTVNQAINSEIRRVGVYDHGKTDFMSTWHLRWKDGGIIWRGGYAPRDSTQVTTVEVTVPPYLYVIMSALASLGILTSVTLVLFNVQHRKHKFVKLSSPTINTIMLLGCICTYSTVFMYSYTSESIYLCKIRVFTLTLGFSMAFGAMFSKTWRVYKIFANKKLLRVTIKDRQLIGIVGALLAVLATILVLHEIIDPLVIETQVLKGEMYTNGNDAEIHPYIRKCVSQYQSYFSWTIYTIEGMLLIFGAFLSYETRKVRIVALNDSHHVGLSVYNVVALTTLCLTLSLALDTHVALVYGCVSGFIVLGTTTTQLIVFVPKVLAVYYPHGAHQPDPMHNTGNSARAGLGTKPASNKPSSNRNVHPSTSDTNSCKIYTIEDPQTTYSEIKDAP